MDVQNHNKVKYFRTPASSIRYSNEDLLNAINAVKEGTLSLRKASKQFGVPAATIYAKIKTNVVKKNRKGPTPYLTEMEERSIVDWIIECSKRGHPRTSIDIRFAAKEILVKFPRENPFKNNVPSYDWYKNFIKRHPDIKIRKPEALSVASSHISDQDLRGWWLQIDKYLKDNSLIDILQDPSRIANCDETKFDFNANPGKVVVEKHSRNSYFAQSGGNKKGITVLHTVLADGSYGDPFLIYPYTRVPEDVKNKMSALQNIDYNYNASGWMTEENFRYYLEFVFVKSMKQKGVQFPVILFMDNHTSHVSMEVSRLANSLGVILIALYPNSTHISQPLDCAVFRGLKAHWSTLLLRKRGENSNFKVNMVNFPELLLELLLTSHNTQAVKNGFRVCGIFPWNISNMDFSKLLTSKKQDVVRSKEVVVFSGLNEANISSQSSVLQSDNSNLCVFPLTPPLSEQTPDSVGHPEETCDSGFDEIDPLSSRASPQIMISSSLNEQIVIDMTAQANDSCVSRLVSSEVKTERNMEIEDVLKELNYEIANVTYEYVNFNEPLENEQTLSVLISNEFETNQCEPMDLSMKPISTIESSSQPPTFNASTPVSYAGSSNFESSVSSSITNSNDNFSRADVFHKLKNLYGESKYKIYNNKKFEPENTDQDLLMRILNSFRPIESASDVLTLPPINKRGGIRQTKKQPFVISSDAFRQFRSKNEKEKMTKKRKLDEDKENKKQERKQRQEAKAKEELEKKKKIAHQKMQKQIENAERQAALKLKNLNKLQ